MKNRRSFLQQGTLATMAILTLKPLKTIAGMGSAITGVPGNGYGKLSFLHTANLNSLHADHVIREIKNIKNNNTNAILLNAGQHMPTESGSLVYDASFNTGNAFSAISGDYKIIHKGKIKTGIINARPNDKDVIQKINALSTLLKKEKGCTVVVCLSGLGYKNEHTPDDITLARESTHLDIIIGGHANNFYRHPAIVLNRNQAEVIIHAAGDTTPFGKIEIDFDAQGHKRNIGFTA